MLDKDEYYCKIFINKDIERFKLNRIIKDIVSGRHDGLILIHGGGVFI
ncbi:MAG TPA: hypothetical protein VF941_19820 [Clostridia bacterium]